MDLPEGASPPEEMEEIGFKYVDSGRVKEGLKLILRAARRYEERKDYEDAARLFRYIGRYLARKASPPEKARPYLLKAASLYINLVEEEISKPDVDLDTLDQYTLNVLEVFAITGGDSKFMTKYGARFGNIYEELGSSFESSGDVKIAARVYESAFHYYKIVGSETDIKRVAGKLLDIYGEITENLVENRDLSAAADAFYVLAKYVRAIFGHDSHYLEIMETAAKNYEKASKLSYSEGNLDGTATNLVKAQYAYMLCENTGRAKLVGINAVRMLYQIASSYRAAGDDKMTQEKLIELAEALIGINKFNEAIKNYKEALNISSNIEQKIRIRLALLKTYIANQRLYDLLDIIEIAEFYVSRKRLAQAYELLVKILEKNSQLEELNKKILEAEGYY